MPIYEYECDAEKHRFEKWQSVHDEPLKTCPICGSSVRKVFHPAGIIFKGSGWYITDSRKPSGKSDAGESAGSETKAESKTETKADKPASESKSNGSSSD